MCNQSVGLVQGAMEEAGIATVSINLLGDVARKVRPPRSLIVPFRFGHPLGRPNDAAQQRQVITEALDLLLTAELPVFANLSTSGI